MENEKDLFIKQKFKDDELISKKANDVFDNFFANDIKKLTINENTDEINNKKQDEKVVELNEHKNIFFKRRKMMTAVASFMIIFLAANAYAATQGYNNIFFVIRNAFSKSQEVTNPDEILEDKDTTISYQSIEIAKDLNIQINRLVVKENEAILYLNIQEGENVKDLPKKYIVYDITDGKKELIGSKKTTRNLVEPLGIRYDEEIKLENMKNETTKISLEILNDTDEKIVEFEIDLTKKEIDIKEGDYASLQKISEVELKNILSKYCLLNYYEDISFDTETEENEVLEKLKIGIAAELMREKELVKTGERVEYTAENLKVGLEEIFEKEITSKIDISNYVEYLNTEGYYGLLPVDGEVLGLCLEVSNISFLNGIYTVEFIYCYPTDVDIEQNTIEELTQYKATMQFEVNNEYEYTRYCLVNIDDVKIEEIEEKNTSEINDKNKEDDLNKNTNTTTIKDSVEDEVTTKSNTTNNTTNTIAVVDLQNTKIDNYASSMSWSYYETDNFKFQYPTDWSIIESTANEALGEKVKLNIVEIFGIATGINKETNEIINSNVRFVLYEPEKLNFNTAQEYANAAARLFSLQDTGAKFTSNKGFEWLEVSKRSIQDDGSEHYLVDYCNYNEITKMGTKFRMFTDRENNYKVINILNKLLGSIEIK